MCAPSFVRARCNTPRLFFACATGDWTFKSYSMIVQYTRSGEEGTEGSGGTGCCCCCCCSRVFNGEDVLERDIYWRVRSCVKYGGLYVCEINPVLGWEYSGKFMRKKKVCRVKVK